MDSPDSPARFTWAGEKKDNLGRPFRFGLIDVQLDHYWLVIRAWGSFSQSRLVYTARCLSPSEIQMHLDRCLVPRERTFIDTRYEPQRVRRIAGHMRWNTMMGDKEMKDYLHEDGIRRIYDKPKVYDTFTGTEMQSGTQPTGYVIEFLFSKNSALNRLALLRDPASLAPDKSLLWTAAADTPDFYWKQTNAHYRKWVTQKDGSLRHEWHGQKDDHTDDCEAQGVVAASMAQLTGAESLEPAASAPPANAGELALAAT
jgi:hypothetical protein